MLYYVHHITWLNRLVSALSGHDLVIDQSPTSIIHDIRDGLIRARINKTIVLR